MTSRVRPSFGYIFLSEFHIRLKFKLTIQINKNKNPSDVL